MSSGRSRSINRTNTARSPTTNVGTPNIAQLLHRFGVLGGERLERPARRDLGRDGVGVELDGSDRGSRSTDSSASFSPWSWRAANSAMCQSRKWSGNASRTAMPHSQREHAACPARPGAGPRRAARPPRRAPGRARTARNRTSQSRPSRNPVDDGLLGVAGEGAAVVEAHGEASASSGGPPGRPHHGRARTMGRSPAPRTSPNAAPATHVGGVVQADVDTGRGHAGRERVPAGAAAEQRGRAERRGRVARRKRRRDRPPQPVAELDLGEVDGAQPPEQQLHRTVRQGRLDARSRRRSAPRPRGRRRSVRRASARSPCQRMLWSAALDSG